LSFLRMRNEKSAETARKSQNRKYFLIL